MIKREFLDALGRAVKMDDVLIYCSPFDGMHALIVTQEDEDGMLYVCRIKTDGLDDGEEWLDAFNAPTLPFTPEELKYSADLRRFVTMSRSIEHIKVSRRCYPITLYSGFIVMKALNQNIKVKGC
jgi:hypothetical protein